MQIDGTVHKVFGQETGAGKKGQWFKQSFLIKTKDRYPKEILITAWNDTCDLIPEAGTEIKAFVSIESREYNQRYYTDIKLKSLKQEGAKQAEPVETGLVIDSESDNLPF